jgi:hypothetical protein
MPRQLWFSQPNGNETTWDIPRIESGVRLDRTEFTSPAVPPGWRLVRAPRPADAGGQGNQQPPPRVFRPNQ